MKRLFFIGVTVFLIACLGCQNKRTSSELIRADSTQHDSHDYQKIAGKYVGKLPCADCEGIETVLILNADNSFSYSSKYLNKSDEVFTKQGKWKMDTAKRIITLQGIDYKFKIGEKSLKQLDLSGNEISGDLADDYILAMQ